MTLCHSFAFCSYFTCCDDFTFCGSILDWSFTVCVILLHFGVILHVVMILHNISRHSISFTFSWLIFYSLCHSSTFWGYFTCSDDFTFWGCFTCCDDFTFCGSIPDWSFRVCFILIQFKVIFLVMILHFEFVSFFYILWLF